MEGFPNVPHLPSCSQFSEEEPARMASLKDYLHRSSFSIIILNAGSYLEHMIGGTVTVKSINS